MSRVLRDQYRQLQRDIKNSKSSVDDDTFHEYGSEWKTRGDVYEEGRLVEYLTKSKKDAVVLNRDTGVYEAWTGGKCVYRGDQIRASKALGDK